MPNKNLEPGGRKFSVGSVLSETLALARQNWISISLIVLFTAAVFTMIDVSADGSAVFQYQSLFSLIVLYLQLVLIVRLLRGSGMLAGKQHDDGGPTMRMYPRAFGQSLLWTLAVLVGLVLLVLPGLWLITLWYICLPIMLAEDSGIIDSFSRSAKLVKPRFWTVALLALIVLSPIAALLALTEFFYSHPDSYPDIPNGIYFGLLNTGLQLAQVAGWVVSVAIYRQLAHQNDGNTVENVFA